MTDDGGVASRVELLYDQLYKLGQELVDALVEERTHALQLPAEFPVKYHKVIIEVDTVLKHVNSDKTLNIRLDWKQFKSKEIPTA